MKFLKDLNIVIGFGCGLIAGVAYVYNTFATIKYVDEVSIQLKTYSDQNRERMMAILVETKDGMRDIKEVVKTIESRTWDLRPAVQALQVKSQ